MINRQTVQRVWFASLTFACLVAAGPARACAPSESDCAPVGQWQLALGVGLGARTNPVAGGDDIPLVLLPQLSYYGERFFLDTTSAGWTLSQGRRHSLNAVATLGLESMYFNDVSLGNFVVEGASGGGYSLMARPGDSANPPPSADAADDSQELDSGRELTLVGQSVTIDDIDDRHMALLGGLEYNHYLGNTAFSAQLLHDISGVHDGQALRLGVDQRLLDGASEWTVAGGALWQSRELVDYYFGLDASEVPATPQLAYRAGDAVTPYVRIGWRRPVSERWTLQATVHHKWFTSAITDSPLVDRDGSTTAFVGGVYHF